MPFLNVKPIARAFSMITLGTEVPNSVFSFYYVKLFLHLYKISGVAFHQAQGPDLSTWKTGSKREISSLRLSLGRPCWIGTQSWRILFSRCTQPIRSSYRKSRHFVYDHVFAEQITSLQSRQSPDEEENEHLKKTVTMLQAQLSLERQKRVTMEEEFGLVLKENRDLERQLGATDAYRARALELEAEVAEMRQMLQSEHPFVNGVEKLVPDSLFAPFREPSQSLLEEMLLSPPEAPRKPLKRSSSETVLSSLAGGDIVKGHEETCIRRAKAVKQRGVSLLHEVDTQYSALKVKYEELLKKCQQDEDSLSHKAVQTSRAPAKEPAAVGAQPEPGTSGWAPASVTPEPVASPTASTPPEYKALFKEIFSCIKKTKQEIDEQRTKYRSLSSHS
ncbi:cerebellar degeneration-related protein 2 isoform X3 [Phacochoerus africanus]|uniref:cerebellar degeneration-related protein 2 isoform X3 n=1 Tax=Phacochoerus africanus TaxID=41426 RepID=UPI001FDA86CC|nr:cerebellar degeneration-related protein 2 isoform X3 [Phacochoerus africanus]